MVAQASATVWLNGVPQFTHTFVCGDVWAVSGFGNIQVTKSLWVPGLGTAGPCAAFLWKRGSEGLPVAQVGSSEHFITYLSQVSPDREDRSDTRPELCS